MTPERLGSRYLLEERIGQGGLGVVWRGRDTTDGTTYAIKLLRDEHAQDPETLTRFVRERTALLRFKHPNVVTLHDMIVERDRLALVMSFVAGGDLDAHRRRQGGRLPHEATELTAQICSALAAAHAAGIVHRDLKPANVLLDSEAGRAAQVRLTDFGIARISGEPSVTSKGYILGTLNYLAPEVIQGGEPTPACDVYAAGITLYELLAGRPPFTGQGATVLYQHLQDAPGRPEGIPDGAWHLITACLDKDPARRPSAAELESALRGAARAMTAPGGYTILPRAGGQTGPAPLVPTEETTSGTIAPPPGYLGPAGGTGSVAIAQPPTAPAWAGATAGRQGGAAWPGLAGQPPAPVPGALGAPRRTGPARWSRRRTAGAGGAIAAVLAVAVVVSFMLLPETPGPTATDSVAATVTASPAVAGTSADAGTSGGHPKGGASATPPAPSGPTPRAATGTAARPTAAVPPAAPETSSPKPSRPSSTGPVSTAWQCGPTAAATLYSTGEDTGQTLRACIRVSGGKLELKGTLSPADPAWGEQIMLALKDPSQQTRARYVSPICTSADCGYSVTITPPSRGKWTVIPQWQRLDGSYQSTGAEPGFVQF